MGAKDILSGKKGEPVCYALSFLFRLPYFLIGCDFIILSYQLLMAKLQLT